MITVEHLTKYFGGAVHGSGLQSAGGVPPGGKLSGGKLSGGKLGRVKRRSGAPSGGAPSSGRLLGILRTTGSLALSDISLEVPAGTIYGLVGYNGAGKTTLLKCIAGIYHPQQGRVLIQGTPTLHRAPGTLFMVADEPYFTPQATPLSLERYYRGYYPLWSSTLYRRLLGLFDLDPRARVEGFSKGMQRQAGMALGLASGATVLLLDESFDGLDLAKRMLIKRMLVHYAQARGAAIMISSHNLAELEDVADRLGMIDGCQLAFSESVEALHAQHPGKSLEEIFLGAHPRKEPNLDLLFEP